LLIGKNEFQAQPSAMQTAPATNIPATFSKRVFSPRNQLRPVDDLEKVFPMLKPKI
jgi:hypothetical protein